MNKILVTGGAGYIGAHSVVELIEAGYEPIVVDSFIYSDGSLLDGIEKITGRRVTFHKGDCQDKGFLDSVLALHPGITCVMHFAALKSVKESVEKPLEYYRNNVGSMLTALELMPTYGIKDFIFSSSCTVYGQPEQIPVNESAPFKPAESPYGATKQIGEQILKDVHKLGYRVVSLRYFNPIGAHPSANIGEMSFGGPPNYLVPYIVETAIGIRERLTVFGNDYNTPDGFCIRDYIHVVDVAKAHVKALHYLEKKPNDSIYSFFNLGTGEGTSVLELINKFVSATGVEIAYTIGPRRPGDIEKVYADPGRANKELNWKAELSIEDALKHAWEWQKALTAKSKV